MDDETKLPPAGPAVTTEEQERLFNALHDLELRSRSGIGKKEYTHEEAEELARYVAQVRMLLTEWGLLEKGGGKNPKTVATLDDLRIRYRELEGMVKEVRNDLRRMKCLPEA
jgi:hypothetical protein